VSEELQQGKRRLKAHCSRELWGDSEALNVWIRSEVMRDCEDIGAQVEPDSEILCVREAELTLLGDFSIVILYRCVPQASAIPAARPSIRFHDEFGLFTVWDNEANF
jgi:hypothetical protein